MEPVADEVVKTEGAKFDIAQCAACDGRHTGIELLPFQRPLPPFTHYYLCPTLGDPVSIHLAMLKTGDAMELAGPIIQELARAQISGRYMVAIWSYNDEGQLGVHKTTQKFPTVDYFPTPEHRNALGILQDLLEREVGPQPVHKPMQQAAPRKPLVQILGAGMPEIKDVEEFTLPMAAASNGNGADDGPFG